MNRGEARRFVHGRLKANGIHRAALEADLLCSEAFGCSRESLLTHPEESVAPVQAKRLFSLLEARILRKPLAYIRGKASFWGMDLEVGEGCLVPRPETEILVETALEFFGGGRFLDWGTGSGCVALALLSARPASQGLMLEKSPAALAWAWRNLRRTSFQDRALLWHGCSLESIPSSWVPLDLIVGNPPYIPTSEMAGLMPDVRLYEPHQALDGGPDGLDDVKAILAGANRLLVSGGTVLLEIGGARQVEILRSTPAERLELVRVEKDLSGKERIVVWRHR
jgi:release factor glutamine methyltransferase